MDDLSSNKWAPCLEKKCCCCKPVKMLAGGPKPNPAMLDRLGRQIFKRREGEYWIPVE